MRVPRATPSFLGVRGSSVSDVSAADVELSSVMGHGAYIAGCKCQP